jgi:hypothetical protein
MATLSAGQRGSADRDRGRSHDRLANPTGPAMLLPERMFGVRTDKRGMTWLERTAAGCACAGQ